MFIRRGLDSHVTPDSCPSIDLYYQNGVPVQGCAADGVVRAVDIQSICPCVSNALFVDQTGEMFEAPIIGAFGIVGETAPG